MVFAYPRPGPEFSGGGHFLLEVKSGEASTNSPKNQPKLPSTSCLFFFILAENVDFIDGFSKFRNLRFLNNFDANLSGASPFSQAWLGCQIEKHVQKNNFRRQISAAKISKPLNLSNRQIAK